MADDVIETLAKLKPTPPDRDAILFAAGAASVRRAPAWKWISAGLLLSNLVVPIVWFATDNRSPPVQPQPDWNLLAEPSPTLPETPSIPFDREASLLNLDPPMPEAVPTSSVVPEQHWTARTNPSDLRFD